MGLTVNDEERVLRYAKLMIFSTLLSIFKFKQHFLISVALVLVLGLAASVYQPAIPGFFMLDDFDNLAPLGHGVASAEGLQTYLATGNAGPLGRPISKLSFLLDDTAWPSEPGPFKRTNLLIHLLCGVLIFAIGRILFRLAAADSFSDWLALAVSALWLVHPIQVSTVMYVVQRMTQLSALFVLLGVVVHLSMRMSDAALTLRRLLVLSFSLGIFTSLAVLSKESGILLPVYILVAELTILAARKSTPRFRAWRTLFVYLPSALLLGYLLYIPRWLGSYTNRDFTLSERLLTQPVVLGDYLYYIVTLKVSGLGLFQDDYPIYRSLVDLPVLGAVIMLAALFWLALSLRKRLPLVSFGILWYFAGHLLEGSTVSLELYFEHRNYLPLFGLLVAFLAAAYFILQRVTLYSRQIILFAALGGGLLSSGITFGYASEWSSPLRLMPIWAVEHPDSPRAQRTYAHTLALAGMTKEALFELDEAYKRFPHDLSIPVMSASIACQTDQPLRYDFSLLAERIGLHRWTDGLRPALQELIGKLPGTYCAEFNSRLERFVAALEGLPGASVRSRGGFKVLQGELAEQRSDLYAALTAYVAIEETLPSVDSALRLTGLYLRMGEFDMALEWLVIAEERDRPDGRGWGPRRRHDFVRHREGIERLAEFSRQTRERTLVP
ncbi:hypothetical protein GO613_05075 [Azoarcus communis]|uniref:hypothetical protein n=1 Tax=Parazoarcus communis TaxID=41977 RepID=UPI00145934AF|nr:hypothetical protein [Parazoarcus communis]NMG47469.1 hypothetical protein [Parazoarcus communis]